MNRWIVLMLAGLMLACAGCAATPPPAPPPVLEPPMTMDPVDTPAPRARHVAPATATPQVEEKVSAVLRDSKSLTDQTYRYIEWPGAKPANVEKLTELKKNVDDATDAIAAARKPPSAQLIRDARAAAEALARFFATKTD